METEFVLFQVNLTYFRKWPQTRLPYVLIRNGIQKSLQNQIYDVAFIEVLIYFKSEQNEYSIA